jgi:hypothetical protein
MIEVNVEHSYNGGDGQSTYRLFVTPEIAAEFVQADEDSERVLQLLWEYEQYVINEYHNGGHDYMGQCIEVSTEGDEEAEKCLSEILEKSPKKSMEEGVNARMRALSKSLDKLATPKTYCVEFIQIKPDRSLRLIILDDLPDSEFKKIENLDPEDPARLSLVESLYEKYGFADEDNYDDDGWGTTIEGLHIRVYDLAKDMHEDTGDGSRLFRDLKGNG